MQVRSLTWCNSFPCFYCVDSCGDSPTPSKFSQIQQWDMDNSTLQHILRHGKLYYPAHTHYGPSPHTRVVCDKCRRGDLRICIGVDSWDLCLPCAERFGNEPVPSPPLPPFVSGVHPQDGCFTAATLGTYGPSCIKGDPPSIFLESFSAVNKATGETPETYNRPF